MVEESSPSPRSSLRGACSSDSALAGVKRARGATRTKRRRSSEYHDEELELLLAWRVMVGCVQGDLLGMQRTLREVLVGK